MDQRPFLEFQMTVPSERHEHVREDQETNGQEWDGEGRHGLVLNGVVCLNFNHYNTKNGSKGSFYSMADISCAIL